jgi:hypothetical protein
MTVVKSLLSCLGLLVMNSICPEAHSQLVERKHKVSIVVIDPLAIQHKGGYEINLEPMGRFYDPHGYTITDKRLAKELAKPSVGDTEKTSYVQLYIEKEQKTSLLQLGHALARIKAAAGRHKDLVILIHLRTMSKKGQSRKE